jgi:hypothetical protein
MKQLRILWWILGFTGGTIILTLVYLFLTGAAETHGALWASSFFRDLSSQGCAIAVIAEIAAIVVIIVILMKGSSNRKSPGDKQ